MQLSVGGNTAGGTTVCSGSSNGNITLTGQTGNVLRWESSIDNGVTWSTIANTTTSQPYLNLTQTTQYRAAVHNGVCAFVYSTISPVVVSIPAVTANAGANNAMCNATSYILQGNNLHQVQHGRLHQDKPGLLFPTRHCQTPQLADYFRVKLTSLPGR